MPTYPFVNPRMQATKDIGSTPTLIFGSQFKCFVDGLVFANQRGNAILASFYLLREEGDPTPQPVEYPFFTDLPLDARKSLDWCEGKSLTLHPGDTLYAYSDYVDNLFNTFVSVRELMETAPTPPIFASAAPSSSR